MDYLPVAWSYQDELSNIEAFKVNFKEARMVYCKREDGFRKIAWAKTASRKEESAYFNFLAMGGLE